MINNKLVDLAVNKIEAEIKATGKQWDRAWVEDYLMADINEGSAIIFPDDDEMVEAVIAKLKDKKLFLGEAVEEDFESLEDIDQGQPQEDMTEVQEAIEAAKEEVVEPTTEEIVGTEQANSTIDVLIADEKSAIEGYKGFLNQVEGTIPDVMFDVLKREIEELIADEEEHIEKLEVIKTSFHLGGIDNE